MSHVNSAGSSSTPKPSVLSGHTRWVHSLSFLPDGIQFLSASLDDTVRTWSTTQARETRPPIISAMISTMALSNDGRWIATGNDTWRVVLWDAATHDKVGESADAHHGPVECLSFSADASAVVSGAGDTTVAVWHVPTGERLAGLFRCHVDAVVSVVFSPDGGRFASTDQSDIRIRDARSGDLSVSLVELGGQVGSLVWPSALSDQVLYASCHDRILSIDPSAGAVRAQWTAHPLSITHIALSRDGQLIAASSRYAKTVQVWNTATQQAYTPVLQHRAFILSIAISSDGSRLTAGGEDSTIYVWPLRGTLEQENASSIMDTDKRFPNDLTHQLTRESHDPVASGGFADIYRGTLQENGEPVRVAIKAIKTYTGEDDDLARKQKRLRREIKVWLNLRHANILPLLGTTMEFGRFPAMVCPWVENGTLTSYLEHHHESLPEVNVLELLSNVACGLQYLHSRSVVHGDLSGSNVLIREDGGAYIADFGLSMLLTELGGSTFATSFHARGTLRWTAPELLDLEVPEDDMEEESPRVAPTIHSDIYSFGGIMLQILSSKVPYHYYMREAQVVHAVSRGMTPRRPNNALITERRWTFIQRCWSRKDIARLRPSSEEIVEFAGEELVGIGA